MVVTTCHASEKESSSKGVEDDQQTIIRWRMDRWGTLECRLDMRDIEVSESVRDWLSGLGRLRREGGPGHED